MRFSAVAAMVSLLVACGVDRGGQEVQQQSLIEEEAVSPSPETFALGTELSESGAVAARGASDSIIRGGEVYVSIDVNGASTGQTIEVQWLDPNGDVIRSEQRMVSKQQRYVPFSSGRTKDWKPGSHRAVIVIDGRRVSEKSFDVM